MLREILGDATKPEKQPLQVQDARPMPLKKTKRTRRATQAQVAYVAKKWPGSISAEWLKEAPGHKATGINLSHDRHQSKLGTFQEDDDDHHWDNTKLLTGN